MVTMAWKEVFYGWKSLLIRLTMLLLGAGVLGSMIIAINVLHHLDFPLSLSQFSVFLLFNLPVVTGVFFPILLLIYTASSFRNFIEKRGLDNLSGLGIPHRNLLTIPLLLGSFCSLMLLFSLNFLSPWSSKAAIEAVEESPPRLYAQTLNQVGDAHVWFDEHQGEYYRSVHYLRDSEYIYAQNAELHATLRLEQGQVTDVHGNWRFDFGEAVVDLGLTSLRSSVHQLDSFALQQKIYNANKPDDKHFYQLELYKRIFLPLSMPGLFLIVFVFTRNNYHPVLSALFTVFVWCVLIRIFDGVNGPTVFVALSPVLTSYLGALLALLLWKEL